MCPQSHKTSHTAFSSHTFLLGQTRSYVQRSASCLRQNLNNVGGGGHVTTSTSPVDVDILALGVVLVGALGLDAEGVSTEVVTLSLQQVGREVSGAVSVVEAQSSAEGGSGDTPEGALADHVSPALLSLLDGGLEEVVEQEVLQVRVVAVSVGDVLEEDGTDNAATTPHEGNGRLVQLPAVLAGSLRHDLSATACSRVR